MDLKTPRPKIEDELICCIIGFAVAPLISKNYPFTVGVFLTYLLIMISRILKQKGGMKNDRRKRKQ